MLNPDSEYLHQLQLDLLEALQTDDPEEDLTQRVWDNREQLQTFILENYANADHITGKTAGHFYSDDESAMNMVLHNFGDVVTAFKDANDDTLIERIENGEWNEIDIIVRCTLMPIAVDQLINSDDPALHLTVRNPERK